jgi:stress response protein YsnF
MISGTGPTSSSPRRLVTALFDSRSAAENAIERLVNAGVPHDRIGLMPGDESEASDEAGASSRPEPRGFWGSLGDWLLPDEDRHLYAEGLSRGGYLISVTTGDEHYARVMAILDSADAIDIDEQAESWRAEGWAGWSGTAAGTSTEVGPATSVSPVVASVRAEDLDAEAVASPRKTGLAGAETGLSERGEQVLPVVDERLRIGMRDVSHGRVRVRSYVVETPVEEQVTLREERVAIEHRPADRALSVADQAFQERTIEAEERGEEAVVSKEVRITEEIVVRKEAGQRTETVFDTVRETKVEVEDERGNRVNGTGTTERK